MATKQASSPADTLREFVRKGQAAQAAVDDLTGRKPADQVRVEPSRDPATGRYRRSRLKR